MDAWELALEAGLQVELHLGEKIRSSVVGVDGELSTRQLLHGAILQKSNGAYVAVQQAFGDVAVAAGRDGLQVMVRGDGVDRSGSGGRPKKNGFFRAIVNCFGGSRA